ncbi:MAG: aldolase/citrate lyase family protein [Eubacteriales bacterium]
MPLTLMYLTNEPAIALIAEKNGVQRIWIDLETLGKEERQHNMNSVKSHHRIQDIEVISNMLTSSELLVRINPMNPGSELEINQVIDAGADIIMLPMWQTTEEVQAFLQLVDGRVQTTLLLETKGAVECVDAVLAMGGFDEIHIGLNDLHLSYGCTFLFELLTNGTVEMLCGKFRQAGIPYGFGGISRIKDGVLPAERIIMEHYRLGSTRAILSRSFCNTAHIQSLSDIENIFDKNMRMIRDYERSLSLKTEKDFIRNRDAIGKIVARTVSCMREAKKCNSVTGS